MGGFWVLWRLCKGNKSFQDGMERIQEYVLDGVVVVCQARGDLEGVADLAAVPAARGAGVLLEVLAGEVDDLGLVDQKGRLAGHLVALALDLAQLGDVEAEDVARLRLVEGRVVERHVDAGLEGLVDGADAVRRQEEQAVVVLEDAQEDGHERVALHVELGALREEDVGLVEQEDAVPEMGQPEHVGQRRLDLVRREAQVAAGDDEQRLLILHGHRLGRRRLSHARHAVEEDDQAAALVLDQILARPLGRHVHVAAFERLPLEVRGDEAAHDLLVVLENLEILKNTGLPPDRLYRNTPFS